MKTKLKTKFAVAISYLYMLLFVYAAFSKLIDFEAFVVQLGQSPLLSAYADWVAVFIPTIEVLIAIFLIIPNLEVIGLYASYGLMLMFTTYIVIILNYSNFIPCSCGGILENLNWTEHLIFNIFFILLALIGIFIHESKNTSIRKKVIYIISICVISIASITILFLLSEQQMQRNNAFIRRYPHHPISDSKSITLDYNSYYIAGFNEGKIILGNTTAPLHIVEIDTTLKNKAVRRIIMEDSKNYPFSAVQLKIKAPHFYLVDGSIPIIYKGMLSTWETTTTEKPDVKFSLLEPIKQDVFIVRHNNAKTAEHELQIIGKENNIATNILQKKIDGIFDTDGILLYNEHLNAITYTYYYRNQTIIIDNKLNLKNTVKTIDTLSQSPLEFTYTKGNTEKKLAKQPITINKYVATAGKYLFIKSDRLGKYESEVIAKQASIIDVYNLENNTYEFSFYFYHHNNEEIKSFKIYNNLIIGITNKHLVVRKLKANYFQLENTKHTWPVSGEDRKPEKRVDRNYKFIHYEN